MIDSDANISSILLELQNNGQIDDIVDFTKFLLKKSNDREKDIETLILDGIAIRNDAGDVFITDNDSITPVKLEIGLIKNTEYIYKLENNGK